MQFPNLFQITIILNYKPRWFHKHLESFSLLFSKHISASPLQTDQKLPKYGINIIKLWQVLLYTMVWGIKLHVQELFFFISLIFSWLKIFLSSIWDHVVFRVTNHKYNYSTPIHCNLVVANIFSFAEFQIMILILIFSVFFMGN